MEKTQQMNFRLTEQTRKELAWVAIEVGMTDAEVLRALINKAFRDSTTRGLIKKYRDLERMRKAGIEPTSYNVRTDNGVKNALEVASAPSNESGTSSITEAQEHSNEWENGLQAVIEIAKAKWVSED